MVKKTKNKIRKNKKIRISNKILRLRRKKRIKFFFKRNFLFKYVPLNPQTNVILAKKFLKKKVIRIRKKKTPIFLRKFVRIIMTKGHLNRAEKLFDSALCLLTKKTRQHPFMLILYFLRKTKISFRLLGIRIRGKSVGIPIPLNNISQYFDAFRLLIKLIRSTKNYSFVSGFDMYFNGLLNKNK